MFRSTGTPLGTPELPGGAQSELGVFVPWVNEEGVGVTVPGGVSNEEGEEVVTTATLAAGPCLPETEQLFYSLHLLPSYSRRWTQFLQHVLTHPLTQSLPNFPHGTTGDAVQ